MNLNLPISVVFKTLHTEKSPYDYELYGIMLGIIANNSYLYLEFSDVERPSNSFYSKNPDYEHAFSSQDNIINLHQTCKKEEAPKIIISWLNSLKRKYSKDLESMYEMKQEEASDEELDSWKNAQLFFNFIGFNCSADWILFSKLIDIKNIKKSCNIDALQSPGDLARSLRDLMGTVDIYNDEFFNTTINVLYEDAEDLLKRFKDLNMGELPYLVAAAISYLQLIGKFQEYIEFTIMSESMSNEDENNMDAASIIQNLVDRIQNN